MPTAIMGSAAQKQQSDGRVHTRTRVRNDELLDKYCGEHGLHIGQYAITNNIPYVGYFALYGLSKDVFTYILEHDEEFNRTFKTTNSQAALLIFSQANGLTLAWCPKYVHVYERIQNTYPECKFTWMLDLQHRIVIFTNYPRLPNGKYPTLYDLVTQSVEIDPRYVHKPKQKKTDYIDWRRSRRRRRDAMFMRPWGL